MNEDEFGLQFGSAGGQSTRFMSYDGDISWSFLRQVIRDFAGTSAELVEVSPLVGGSINTTVLLGLKDGQRAVMKLSEHRVNRSYEHEAHQLDLLRSIGVPTPKVFKWKIGSLDDPHSFLLMEFVEGVDLHEAKQRAAPEQFDALQQQLARIVVDMHSQTAPQFGRALPGAHQSYDSWPRFYREIYDTIWHDIERNGHLPPKMRKQIGKLHENLEKLIATSDKPRLCHWDIWSTNVLCRADSEGNWAIVALLDPMCKYAHNEAEIAYIDLFHTGSPTFLKAYQEKFRLDDGYHRVRKHIYQLYPLINHVHLFGSEYLKHLQSAVERTHALI